MRRTLASEATCLFRAPSEGGTSRPRQVARKTPAGAHGREERFVRDFVTVGSLILLVASRRCVENAAPSPYKPRGSQSPEELRDGRGATFEAALQKARARHAPSSRRSPPPVYQGDEVQALGLSVLERRAPRTLGDGSAEPAGRGNRRLRRSRASSRPKPRPRCAARPGRGGALHGPERSQETFVERALAAPYPPRSGRWRAQRPTPPTSRIADLGGFSKTPSRTA